MLVSFKRGSHCPNFTDIFYIFFGMALNYICIVKTPEKWLKYHVRNLLTFTSFLDEEHPHWLYYNVYEVKTRKQVASFTKHAKPTKKSV